MAQPEKKVTLEDFDMGDTLGEGSYGIVSLATMKSTGQKYAIKVLDKKQLIKENKVQAVSRERNVLNQMNHPFVVKLYYAMQDPANLYFVMEYCQGGELFHYIKKLGAFNNECSIFYTAEIVVALEYLHSKGIIHRDLKPENILLATGGHIKLIDFGTAKDISSTDGKPRSDSFCGTAEYVSPELLNEKPASPASDLWALGCIIYQLICGRPPFKGKTQYQTFQLVSKGQYAYPEYFPPKARELIDKLLVLNPENRLGYGTTSYADLKADPFFVNIKSNWDSLHTITPPALKPPSVKPSFPNEEEVKRQNTILVKSKSAIPFNIYDLPDEFLLKVLFYLPFKDLLRASQVCKRLQTLTLNSQLWDYWLSFYEKPLQLAASADELSGSMESELAALNIDPQTNEVVSASRNKLVDFLASETSIDYSFQRTFLLTYQTFMTPQSLLLGFFRRYHGIYPVLPRLLRLVSVLKTWIDLYFQRDFDKNMIMALKVFIRGKLMYDAKPTVAQNLANSLLKNLNPHLKKKPSQAQNPLPPKIAKVPEGAAWFDIPEEELARQLTLGDFELFTNIKSSELFNLNWTNEKATELSPHVCKMIHRFKLICQWVPTVIVKSEKLKERVKTLARIIRIAKHLRELNNFYGLMACMAGISCGSVSRLKFTFEALPREEKKILAALEAEMGQENIHTKYRETLSKISPPCIPYLGMLLKDLTIVEQANADIVNGLVNFKKRRLMYNVISLLDQYQTYRYPNVELPAVKALIDNMLANALDDQEAYNLSLKIEPRGAKKSDIN
eukprot:TRINITY_DN10866_c0_g1_i1.p1 TRINITY_DN10866_c0_g1~~TRINITY_DN10866_c0_g1_i1.p1  ORF type:complete len:788 (-),score=154.84 TRINITY_DN10866_c0_g1_i1:93-2456(-)